MANELKASKEIEIRFSELDPMNIVWHGSYMKYFEDAREEFGRKYDFGYMFIYGNGYFAPIVDISFKYKRPILYGMKVRIDIKYCPTESAKIVFEYEIHNVEDESLIATGQSVQVFLDKDYNLVWYVPEFYDNWKKKWNVI